MSNLIDRDKLLEMLKERKKPNNGGEDGTKERYRYMQWLTDYNAVKEAPPAEPKRGKWILDPDTGGITCEACGAPVENASYFCPWCGADMRAEE